MRNSTSGLPDLLSRFVGSLSLFLIFGFLVGLEITLLCWLRTIQYGEEVFVFGLLALVLTLSSACVFLDGFPA